LPPRINARDLTGIQWVPQNPGSFSYSLDQVGFEQIPHPTPSPVAVPRLSPAALPTWVSFLDPSQTLVFNGSPINLSLVFSDGPGRYQATVVDDHDQPVRILFDQLMNSSSSTWAEWDGKNFKNEEVAPGRYFVVLSKDGRPLKSLLLLKN